RSAASPFPGSERTCVRRARRCASRNGCLLAPGNRSPRVRRDGYACRWRSWDRRPDASRLQDEAYLPVRSKRLVVEDRAPLLYFQLVSDARELVVIAADIGVDRLITHP